jgi:hypothetical protein
MRSQNSGPRGPRLGANQAEEDDAFLSGALTDVSRDNLPSLTLDFVDRPRCQNQEGFERPIPK